MQRCIKCQLPESYETIEFDETGTCNICTRHQQARSTDQASVQTNDNLKDVIEQFRGRWSYDALVPFSGGKDSTFTLWYAVRVLGFKVLAVQFDHGFLRAGVRRNNERTIKRLGCDIQTFTPSWRLVRRVMLESLVRKGDFCWHCHTGIFAYPMHVALKEQVPLIIWGEPSTTYTAYYGKNETEEVDETRFNRFVNLGITAEDMAEMIKKDFDFDYRDLKPFTYPPKEDLKKLGVRSICLGSYIPWDTKAQTEIIQKELGWQGDQVENMPAMWPYEKIECSMQGVRDYIKWLKRGYSRIDQMCALDVRHGRMTPEEAKHVIDSCPIKRPPSLDLFLEYIGMTENEFNETVYRSVVPPHEPVFPVEHAAKTHDFDQWYREPRA